MPDIRKAIIKGTEYDIVSKTDTTLILENMPADAKSTGDRIAATNARIDGILQSEAKVFNADTHFDFPSIGSIDCIYKAYIEKKTYQWNAEKLIYEPLNNTSFEDITLINGGNANGTNTIY